MSDVQDLCSSPAMTVPQARILHRIRETPRDPGRDTPWLALAHPPDAPATAALKGGLAPWQVRKVRRHIVDHLDQGLPIARLAALLGVSPGHFCRAFKASFGQSPHSYITRLRIRQAQYLMLNSPDPLGAIAPACGFTDQPHLTRMFRKMTGHTPRRWRRLHTTP